MAESLEGFTALLEEFGSLAAPRDGDDESGFCGPPSTSFAEFLGYPTSQLDRGGGGMLFQPTFREPATTERERYGAFTGSEHETGTATSGLLLGGLVLPESGEELLPSEHLQDVGQSLPDLASELLHAQSSQYSEVSRREETLRKLQVELHKEKEQLHSVERDLYGASKSICLAQDESAQTDLECKNLEKEITALVSEIQQLKNELKRSNDAMEEEGKTQRKYLEKMNSHKVLTEKAEQSCPVQQELEELRRRIKNLKERRGVYMQGDGLKILSGEKQRALQEQTEAAKATSVVLERVNKELQAKVWDGKDHMQQLKRDVEMAKKRHQAQLTRLHRQLQEAQSRRRQWGEEAERLRTAITQLRQKM